MQNDDEMKLNILQELADALGDENEIEVDTNLFWELLVINCPKKWI